MMSMKKGLSLKNRMKLKLVIVLTIATLLLSVFALYLVVNVKPEDDIDYLELYQNDYLRLKEKNQDYLGVFTDESFNINIKVVKGDDNSKYRYYVWEKNNYSFEGSPYFDYENTLDDQNLILYNCYFDDINTDGNYYFFTGDEVREYKLYAIFDVQLVNEDECYYPEASRQFNLPYYNEEYFDAYKKALTEGSYYCSGYDPDISDKLFTVVNNTEDDYVKRIFLFVQTDKVKLSDSLEIIENMYK